MSFHPNDVARRARMSSLALVVGFLFLIGAFFKTQVIQNRQYVMQSEENRLRALGHEEVRRQIRGIQGVAKWRVGSWEKRLVGALGASTDLWFHSLNFTQCGHPRS